MKNIIKVYPNREVSKVRPKQNDNKKQVLCWSYKCRNYLLTFNSTSRSSRESNREIADTDKGKRERDGGKCKQHP